MLPVGNSSPAYKYTVGKELLMPVKAIVANTTLIDGKATINSIQIPHTAFDAMSVHFRPNCFIAIMLMNVPGNLKCSQNWNVEYNIGWNWIRHSQKILTPVPLKWRHFGKCCRHFGQCIGQRRRSTCRTPANWSTCTMCLIACAVYESNQGNCHVSHLLLILLWPHASRCPF